MCQQKRRRPLTKTVPHPQCLSLGCTQEAHKTYTKAHHIVPVAPLPRRSSHPPNLFICPAAVCIQISSQGRQKGWTGIIRRSFGISFNGCFIVGEERQRDHNVDDYYSDDVNVVVTYHTAAGAAPHADQEAEKLDSSVVCHNQSSGGRDRDFQKWNDDCSNLEDFRFSVPRPSSSPSSSSSQS